ncbi:hypothetical protein HMPREF3185_01345 [Porphyromonas somerae]|uniref:Uncharacterized protein n=1 Tax=Porphyromonas somerae TaxID=322095 RepID=A0A134B6D4_9PORP|nr:hypothetical protein HMPREF3184_01345 [Porphyromonadaceae bacterium KA00676]KXB75497.1 hypothetical protein HMPREF3185_01345 [Porphyromonas somerae]
MEILFINIYVNISWLSPEGISKHQPHHRACRRWGCMLGMKAGGHPSAVKRKISPRSSYFSAT